MTDDRAAAYPGATPVVGAALIMLLTVLVYAPALRGGFVFDDRALITENQMVKASDGLYRFWCTAESPDYRPLTWSLWWLEWRLWGDRATGYHVVNVLFHAVDAVLVWVILRRLKVPGAWLAATVFAIHPVNVATVAWISEQKNTLSMLFYALTILLYLRFEKENRWCWYALSLTTFCLALLSKTAVVMLPVVLLGCIWWMRGRVRTKDYLCCVPYFVASLVLGLVTIVQHQRALDEAVQTGSVAARLAAAGLAPWFYLSKALVPINLTMLYPKWEMDPAHWVSYLPGIALIGCLIVFWWKRETWGRPLFFGLGYFVVMLFPVLGFFDQAFYRYSRVADHWQYYAIIGVVALAVAIGRRIGDRMSEQRRYLGMTAGTAVVIVLGVAAWQRSCVYADEETLWRDNVAKNPKAWAAHNNLGVALERANRIQEAIEHYEEALRIKPEYAEADYNLGGALVRLGRGQEAVGHYEQALRVRPDFAAAHNNLGAALVRLGRVQEAVGHYERVLRMRPDSAEAHNNLANALARFGKIPEAVKHYEQALQLNPDYGEPRNNLAWLLATLAPAEGGDPPRAVALAERACETAGNRVAAYWDTLAVAYAAAGRFDKASATAQKAIGLAYSDGRPDLAREIGARLELYQSGHVYRQVVGASRP